MAEDLLDQLLAAASEDISENAGDKEFSAIHTGDTDSSDDEDNRDPSNCLLNECGKSIKGLLCVTSETKSPIKEAPKSWTSKPKPVQDSSKNVFGLRIVNPLLPSNVIEERLCNREVIDFDRIKFYIKNIPTDKDFVVAGAIVNKICKTSQNGKKFCMWTLSDLKLQLKSVVVFLFGSAYKELWKVAVGMVVGILNPAVFNGKDDSKEEAKFNVNNHQQVMVLGQSKDYSVCKSLKQSGERCTMFVNKSVCEYCVYHVKKEYKQFSNRSGLQSGFTHGTRDLTNLRNKVLGKDQVFYGGRLYTAIKNPKQVAKDKQLIDSLNGKKLNLVAKQIKQKQAAHLELQAGQRARDLKLLKQLGVDVPVTPKPITSHTEVSQAELPKQKSLETTVKQPQLTNSPKLLPQSQLIDLNIDFKNAPSTLKLNKRATFAKQKAIQWVQANGSIKKSNPNSINAENHKKRPLENAEPAPDPKLTKILENEFFSERFKKLMTASSAYGDLLELQQRQKLFKKLEMKEQLEEKMTNTFKMPCKAVRCLKCKYTNFSASDLCKAEGHPLKVFDTIKRFFKCGNCGNRTVSLQVVPIEACKNCGNSKWEKTGMMKERKVDISAPKLSIRGGEQKFVNSVIADSNLDLMVPDE